MGKFISYISKNWTTYTQIEFLMPDIPVAIEPRKSPYGQDYQYWSILSREEIDEYTDIYVEFFNRISMVEYFDKYLIILPVAIFPVENIENNTMDSHDLLKKYGLINSYYISFRDHKIQKMFHLFDYDSPWKINCQIISGLDENGGNITVYNNGASNSLLNLADKYYKIDKDADIIFNKVIDWLLSGFTIKCPYTFKPDLKGQRLDVIQFNSIIRESSNIKNETLKELLLNMREELKKSTVLLQEFYQQFNIKI